MNNYVYKDKDDTADGERNSLLIPRYKALGRTSPEGKVYPNKPIANPNEEDLVPVRSIITKTTGTLTVVTPDLIGTKFNDLTDGAAIGLSFATSLTEGITQSSLGLKHGGHERIINQEGYLKAPKAGEFREEGRWMYLKTRTGDLKWPRPINLVTVGKTSFKSGELMCTAYSTTSPIYRLAALINLMRAKGSNATKYFEKDSKVISDCYALDSGKIKYVEVNGDIEVWIGDRLYDYNPECMYYFPDGAEVKKFQRICSGIINMNHVVAEVGSNVNDVYLVFRKQFYTLMDRGFASSDVTDLNSTQEELVELLFKTLTSTEIDEETAEIMNVNYQGAQSGILSRNSFYTVLSYGFSPRVVSRALKGDLQLAGDVMTETVLGLLLNNELDTKKKNKWDRSSSK